MYEKEMILLGYKMREYLKRYRKFHDMAPHEKRANINSHIDLSKVVDILNETSLKNIEKARLYELKKFIKYCKYGYINNGYVTNAPSYDYIKLLGFEDALENIDLYSYDMFRSYDNAVNKYSLQERLLFGLPLSMEEYNDININNNPFNVYRKLK